MHPKFVVDSMRRQGRAPVSIQISFITARKRSLGQGNIFTPVCHSVHRWGGVWSGGRVPAPGGGREGGWCLVLEGVPAPRGSGPRGSACSGGACSRGSGPGGAWWRPPRTVTAAGGTHPTAMHSCFHSVFAKLSKIIDWRTHLRNLRFREIQDPPLGNAMNTFV